MHSFDASSLQNTLSTIAVSALGVPFLAWAMRRALTEWSPRNPLNTWARALTVASAHVLLGLVLTLALTLDTHTAVAVAFARSGLLIAVIAHAYRIGYSFALGVTLLTQLFALLASGAVTIALMGAWAVSPLLAALVVLAGVAGLTLHQLSARRLQARFDAVE